MEIWIRVLKSFTGEAGLLLLILAILLMLEWRSAPKPNRDAGSPRWWALSGRLKLILVAGVFVSLSVASCAGFPEFFASPLVKAAGQEAGPACHPKEKNVIVVLGGGASFPSQPGEASLQRLLASVQLGRELESEGSSSVDYIFSGGVTFPDTGLSEAAIFAKFFGYFAPGTGARPKNRVHLEQESRTTFENLVNVIRNHPEIRSNSRVWLVTSAEHMLRARLTARGQGLEVCPYPSAPARYRPTAVFSFSTMARASQVLHEYIGLVGYALLGRF